MVREICHHTEVGLLPNNWTIKKIRGFTDATSGGTPSTFISEYWNGNIRWMNSGELNLRKVYDVKGRITELGLKNSSTKTIPKNCVLIGLAGQGKTRGTVAINYVELCINQSICAIFPNKSFIPEYLYYNLDSRYNELRNLSTGEGGRGGLNLTIIRNIRIPFPPTIEEQSAISQILSDTDELIQQLDHLITKKKNIKYGALQELLTGKRRLDGCSEEWKMSTMGKICKFTQGIQIPFHQMYSERKSDSIRYLYIHDFESDDNKKFVDNVYPNNLVTENDIVMANTGHTSGKSFKGKLGVLSNNAFKITFKNNVLLRDFLYEFLQSDLFNIQRKQFFNTTGQPHVGHDNIAKIVIPLPLIDEQQKIISIFSDMNAEIEKLETKKERYNMIKNGMMQKLLTGEIRVK